MKRCLVDTNIILRLLLLDHDQFSPRAVALFERAARGEVFLVVEDIILLEAAFVLKSVFKLSRDKIYESLHKLIKLPGVELSNFDRAFDALERFKARSIDLADAYLASTAFQQGVPIASFDEDLRKFKDVDLFNF